MVLLDAMACGTAVLSTRSGRTNDVITDGLDGYLVPMYDAAAMAKRITRLSVDERLYRSVSWRGPTTIERGSFQDVAGRASNEGTWCLITGCE